jgi:Secretion system C-terminal sorting domain
MFKIILLFILFSLYIFPQPLLEENFDYSIGDLVSSSDWEEDPTGSTDIEVISGNLSYTSYPSSSIGNEIFVDGGASGRSGVKKSFTSISGDGSIVYASFLMDVIDLSDLDISSSNGDNFFSFQTSGSDNRGYVYIKQSATTNKFNIGFAKSSSSSLTYLTADLDINTTYLIVVSYIFKSGNDEVRFWINPDLSGTEPSPDISLTSGTDADDIGYVQFRQRPSSGNINIDGIRVATSWSQAPLPVELTSFTASAIDNQIHLNWKTATEINNFGFDIERASSQILSGQDVWDKIGFVKGYGNSNSEKEYFYTDKNISTSGKYFYRLREINTNGSFKYSNIIEVDFIVPLKFKLSQNYPNPFNPVTNIKFEFDKSSNARLTVYDDLGNKVANLFKGRAEAGREYKIKFDGSALSSGVYYYRLTGGNKTEIKKMLLLK